MTSTSHHPRKRFGQHFLHDRHVIEHIISVIAPQSEDIFLEIGPGPGVLTFALRPKIKKLFAVEIDRDLATTLRTHFSEDPQFILHEGDALDFDLSTLQTPKTLRLVGNLPYNISSPLIFHLLNQCDYWHDAHFMLQKEVVDRMAAKPGSSDYGRLSVMVQHTCEVTALFDVSRGAFTPPPKVTSAIVRLVPHAPDFYPKVDKQLFSDIVRLAFCQRRKTLRSALQSVIARDAWGTAPVDCGLRAEQLSVTDFIALTHFSKTQSL